MDNMEASPQSRLGAVKKRLQEFSIPKVDPALKRKVQKATLAGLVGLGTLTGPETSVTNIKFTQAPLPSATPTSTYIPDVHEGGEDPKDIENHVEKLVIDQLFQSAKIGNDIVFSIDENGKPFQKNNSPKATEALIEKMRRYLHSDSPKEIQLSRQLLNSISPSDINSSGTNSSFANSDVFIIDSRFVVSISEGMISGFELIKADSDFYLSAIFSDVPEPLLERLMQLYPNNILSRYALKENTGSLIGYFWANDPEQKLDTTRANQLIDLIERSIPHETRPTAESQRDFDIKYSSILTTLGTFLRSPGVSIEKVAHYIEIAKKTSDQTSFYKTIQAAIGYEETLEAKRQGNISYSQQSDSENNEYSFDDYSSLIADIESEYSGTYHSLGGIFVGLQAMNIPPIEAKIFLQKLSHIDQKALSKLKARDINADWINLINFTNYSFSCVSNLDEALEFAELMAESYDNSEIDPQDLYSYTVDFLFKFDPSLPQLKDFIQKIQNPQLIPAGQGYDDERDKKIESLMNIVKIASDDPEIQQNIDNFFHNRGFAGNIAHSLLTMHDVSPEVRNRLITGADFANDQATIAMMARVINKTVEGKHSDEFVRKAVEFADAIHRYQDESLHETTDSLRKDYYIGNLSPLALLKFCTVKGRASDFEAITYTSSFIKSYDKLKQSLPPEEYYQMLKQHPEDAALLSVMLGRYGKLAAEVRQNPELFRGLIGKALEKYKDYDGFISEELQSLLVEGIVAGVTNPESNEDFTNLIIEMYKSYPQYRPLASYIMTAHKEAFQGDNVPGYVHDYIESLPTVEKPLPPKWDGNEVTFGLYYVKEGPNDTPASIPHFKKLGFSETVDGNIRHLTKLLSNGKRIVIDVRFDKPSPAHGYGLIASLIHSYETNEFFEKQPPGSFKDTIIFGGSCRSASEITNVWNRGYDGSQFVVSESIGDPYVNLLVIDGIVKATEEGGGTITSWDNVENRMKGMISVRGVKLPNSDRVMFINYVRKHLDKFPGLKLPQQGSVTSHVLPS